MWHRFGQGFSEVILCAAKFTEAQNERDLSTRHLLWALVSESDKPAARVMSALGIALPALRHAAEQAIPGEKMTGCDLPTLTEEARKTIEATYQLAAGFDDEYIGGEHLLLAFLREPEGSDAGRILASFGVTWQQAMDALIVQQSWRRARIEHASPKQSARHLVLKLRGKAGTLKRMVYGLSHYQQPFMPYLLFRKKTTDNPYPLYTRLRCRPAYWDPLLGHWMITRYKDVIAALGETRFSQRIYSPSAWSHADLPPLVQREFRCLQNGIDRQMLFQDAPEQPRQRALVAKRFTPRVISQMQDHMQETADALFDSLQASGGMDVIADFAVQYPLLFIARMMGLPADDLPLFKKWSHHYFKYLTFETTLAEDLDSYQSVQEASAYFRALLPARRLAGKDDLISLLLQADENQECLPEDDVVANCLLLLATGHENTTRLLSSGVLALMRTPAQWRKLCDDPSLVVPAVEEMLRFDSPVQWTLRYLEEDTEWQGHSLKKGQKVQIGIGPANHDSAQFPNADHFEITRRENRHVAFGHGPHFCLGAALTRLEAQVFFRGLSKRFPDLHLEKPPEWRQEGLAFRGLKSLHVGWGAKYSVSRNQEK